MDTPRRSRQIPQRRDSQASDVEMQLLHKSKANSLTAGKNTLRRAATAGANFFNLSSFQTSIPGQLSNLLQAPAPLSRDALWDIIERSERLYKVYSWSGFILGFASLGYCMVAANAAFVTVYNEGYQQGFNIANTTLTNNQPINMPGLPNNIDNLAWIFKVLFFTIPFLLASNYFAMIAGIDESTKKKNLLAFSISALLAAIACTTTLEWNPSHYINVGNASGFWEQIYQACANNATQNTVCAAVLSQINSNQIGNSQLQLMPTTYINNLSNIVNYILPVSVTIMANLFYCLAYKTIETEQKARKSLTDIETSHARAATSATILRRESIISSTSSKANPFKDREPHF